MEKLKDNIIKDINNLQKAKIYLGRGQNPPKGRRVQTGPRFGRYYEVSEEEKLENEELSERFKQAGFGLYEVGGSIRDKLLGCKSSDFDFATDALPDETKKILEDSRLGSVFEIGKEYGTIGIETKDGRKLEITTFRDEVYPSSSRKPVVSFGKELEKDLARRDFTINSMAKDMTTGQIIDPFGGRKDLEEGKIKTVGNAKDRFAEDPLRMLRAIRFASQLGFEIDSEMPEPEKLKNISKERISSELSKILLSPDPKRGISLTKDFGLMEYVVPKLKDTYGVIQNRHHYTDVFNHILDVVENASRHKLQGKDKLILMLSALLHDIGKPAAKTGGERESVHFYDHEKIGSKMAEEILTDLRFDNNTIDRVSKIIRNHMKPILSEPTQKVVNRLVNNIGHEDAGILFHLVQSDAAASVKKRDAEYKKYMEILNNTLLPKEKMESPINGIEIMERFSVPAGRLVGEVKSFLIDKVIDGELQPDDKEEACRIAEVFLANKMKEVEYMKEEKSMDSGKESVKEMKERLLSNIEHFLEKYENDEESEEAKAEFSDIAKEIERLGLYKTLDKEKGLTEKAIFKCEETAKRDIQIFLKGYESLAYLGMDYSDNRLNELFQKACQVNENEGLKMSMDSSDRIGRIISVDSVAHALHQNKDEDGRSQYKILDDLADVSKSFGEQERSTRLLIIGNPEKVSDIEKMMNIEILQKGRLERSGKFWNLFEKAIKEGVSKLSNLELVALREWLYARM